MWNLPALKKYGDSSDRTSVVKDHSRGPISFGCFDGRRTSPRLQCEFAETQDVARDARLEELNLVRRHFGCGGCHCLRMSRRGRWRTMYKGLMLRVRRGGLEGKFCYRSQGLVGLPRARPYWVYLPSDTAL